MRLQRAVLSHPQATCPGPLSPETGSGTARAWEGRGCPAGGVSRGTQKEGDRAGVRRGPRSVPWSHTSRWQVPRAPLHRHRTRPPRHVAFPGRSQPPLGWRRGSVQGRWARPRSRQHLGAQGGSGGPRRLSVGGQVGQFLPHQQRYEVQREGGDFCFSAVVRPQMRSWDST